MDSPGSGTSRGFTKLPYAPQCFPPEIGYSDGSETTGLGSWDFSSSSPPLERSGMSYPLGWQREIPTRGRRLPAGRRVCCDPLTDRWSSFSQNRSKETNGGEWKGVRVTVSPLIKQATKMEPAFWKGGRINMGSQGSAGIEGSIQVPPSVVPGAA